MMMMMMIDETKVIDRDEGGRELVALFWREDGA
jgi:hypothetical protein